MKDAPAPCAGHHGKGHPVVGKDGVQEADGAGGNEQKGN